MNPKVMIIDDEVDIRAYLTAVLEDNGYETCTINSNESIIDAVIRQRPDVILLDIMMPKRSGVSLYRDLKSSDTFKGLPVVILTGMTRAKDFREGGWKKIVNDPTLPMPEGFIEKPIDLTALLDLINRLLSQGDV